MDWRFLFFSLRGRITPAWLLLGLIIYTIIYVVITILYRDCISSTDRVYSELTTSGIVWSIGALPLMIKRFQDIDLHGSFALLFVIYLIIVKYFALGMTFSPYILLYFVPIVSFYFYLNFLVSPGTRHANQYGPDPDEQPLRLFGRLLLD